MYGKSSCTGFCQRRRDPRRGNQSWNRPHEEKILSFHGNVFSRPLPLSLSTRGIGFGTQFLAYISKKYNYSKTKVYIPDIQKMYRAFLGIFEAKIQMINYGDYIENVEAKRSPDLSWDHVRIAELVVRLPEPISRIVSVAGSVQQYDNRYLSFIPSEFHDDHGNFIPEPEFVTLSNLRKVVETLSNPNTNAEYRQKFRQKNPIPGTTWNSDDILMNPDQIIPPDYLDTIEQFREDISGISAFVDQLEGSNSSERPLVVEVAL